MPLAHFELKCFPKCLFKWFFDEKTLSRTNSIAKILILDTPEVSGLLISIVKFTRPETSGDRIYRNI